MLFKPNETVIFFGDSITHANKSEVEGSYLWDVLGNGYVNMVNSYYHLYHPELNLRVINQGISGNRSIDLVNRLDQDVLAYHPNHVVMMIGVNDAWRQLDCPHMPMFQLTEDGYRKNIVTIVERLLEQKINVVLMSPFFLETNKENDLRKKTDSYNVILREIANQYNLLFIDVQKEFDKLLKKISVLTLSGDRIHMNMAGNMFLRDQVIKHLNK